MLATTKNQLRDIQKFCQQWKTRHEVAAKPPKGEVHNLQILIGSRGASRRHSRYANTVNYTAPGEDYEASERKTISIFWLVHLVEERLYEVVYDAQELPIWPTTQEPAPPSMKN
ncbi:hypothetical protein Slin15195_G046840 [Septoria linicola]|uniref:Uncharacterized protein n=1 Tax=Septoria linicola TaxID=215465 RepID=A0A9Q9ALV1_9PEZI|nr:hypothetical protein Slin15195_G046840 [Septoria linicola]